MRLFSNDLRAKTAPALLCLLLLITAAACGPGTPEEKVTQTRGQYDVVLNTWFPKPVEPAPMEAAVDEMEGELEEAIEEVEEELAEPDEIAAGAEAAEETLTEPEPAGPVMSTVVFDLIVQFDGKEPLEGITVLATQADASGAEKKVWREFLSIPSIVKAETKQITFEEEVELAEGDQFSVLLEQSVDPADYDKYPEYASAQ